MAMSTRDIRPSPIEQEAPFVNYLGYKNATRPLKVDELVLLHKELDYVQRFTTRYKLLFDDHLMKLDPNLYKKYDHMCEVLVTMQGRKEHSAVHCNQAQIDLLTVGDVSRDKGIARIMIGRKSIHHLKLKNNNNIHKVIRRNVIINAPNPLYIHGTTQKQ